jgi:hypothetical protein
MSDQIGAENSRSPQGGSLVCEANSRLTAPPFLFYVQNYCEYIREILKDSLTLFPNMNVVMLTHKPSPPFINVGINWQHTLVVEGGRDSQESSLGNIIWNDRPLLVRVDKLRDLSKNNIIFDYSLPNLINIESSPAELKHFLNKCYYVSPTIYAPVFSLTKTIPSLTTFINTSEPRRAALLANLPHDHINRNDCFGKSELRKLYSESRILINVHQTPHHLTCEELRILPALSSGCLILCEDSPLKQHLPYSRYIFWESYENMVFRFHDIQAHYEEKWNEIFGESSRLAEIIREMEQWNRLQVQIALFRQTPKQNVGFAQLNTTGFSVVHNAGFFSCCSVVLHLIVQFVNRFGKLPSVVDTTETLEWYKPKCRKNPDIFHEYFVRKGDPPVVSAGINIQYNEHLQFSDYRGLPFDLLNPFVDHYFSPSVVIQERQVMLEKKYNIDFETTCVVFLRGNDKKTECHIPSYGEYHAAIATLKKDHPEITSWLIQSDETEFIDEMILFYDKPNDSERAFCFADEIRHIASTPSTTVDIVQSDKNNEFSKYYLAITRIMSRCKYVIFNTGNCSIWIALFRGNMDRVVQLR